MKSPVLDVKLTGYAKLAKVLTAFADDGTYRGAFRDAMTTILEHMRDYAARITHVDTGMLQDSHRVEYDSHRMRGRLYIDPLALAITRTGRLRFPLLFVAEYAKWEHDRGGSHAFYDRTMKQAAPEAAALGIKSIVSYLDTRASRRNYAD